MGQAVSYLYTIRLQCDAPGCEEVDAPRNSYVEEKDQKDLDDWGEDNGWAVYESTFPEWRRKVKHLCPDCQAKGYFLSHWPDGEPRIILGAKKS